MSLNMQQEIEVRFCTASEYLHINRNEPGRDNLIGQNGFKASDITVTTIIKASQIKKLLFLVHFDVQVQQVKFL